ncbi:hypothetical protein GCM10008968_28850 [Bacillus horti]
MGESQTWNLIGYEVMITPEDLKVGNGTLHMKNEDEYIAEFFRFRTHAVINGEDTVLQSSSVAGNGINIAQDTTGSVESRGYVNNQGDAIRLHEINEIYMVVEWWDLDESERNSERIELYNDNKGSSFLN